MSGRNREPPPHSIKGEPQTLIREPPFGRFLGPISNHRPHPALMMMEESLAAQHQEIQGLLIDNQRLAATHVALKQELEVSHHELQRMVHIAGSVNAEKDCQLRELYEKSLKMEAEVHAADAMRTELLQVRSDIQKLNYARQELWGQFQVLSQDLNRSTSDVQQGPALKAEIENMKQELQRARAAIEYEKKGHAENYEQGQAMQKNLVLMAREMEKLRAEVANVDKREHASAAIGNSSAGYNGAYGNPETGYGGNPYPAYYGLNPVQGGGENAAHYGPVPGAWGAYEYDMQKPQGHQ